MKDFDDVADFTIVYIEEAHPSEGWRIRVRSFDSLSLYRNRFGGMRDLAIFCGDTRVRAENRNGMREF